MNKIPMTFNDFLKGGKKYATLSDHSDKVIPLKFSHNDTTEIL